MTETEKLDLVPDEIKDKSCMEFTPKELKLIINLNFNSKVYEGICRSFKEDLYLKNEFIKEKYCYYEKEI